MDVAGHVARMGARVDAYKAFMGRTEGKRPLTTPRFRCEDDIKMDLQEVEWGGMDWMDLAQGRDRWWAPINGVMNLWTS